jgi:hypothetical protein
MDGGDVGAIRCRGVLTQEPRKSVLRELLFDRRQPGRAFGMARRDQMLVENGMLDY